VTQTVVGAYTDLSELPWIDLESDRYIHDAHALIRETRAKSPVARSQRGLEFFRHEALKKISLDRTFETPTTNYFVNKGAGPWAIEMFNQGMIVHMEAARHLEHRRVMVRAFTKAKIGSQTEAMQEIATRLVDKFVASGEAEIIDDFTHLFSISVLCSTLGVPPEDVEEIAGSTAKMHWLLAHDMRPGNHELEPALEHLYGYIGRMFKDRRTQPGDDFLSVLLEGQAESGLTDDEIIWEFVNLLFAGHDTTRYQLASMVRTLLLADVWETIADDPDALILPAIAESMRLNPIVQYRTRVTTVDSEVDGVSMPPGTNLAMNWIAAMRDPDEFERPDEFILDRPLGRRFDFGAGVHKCIGEGLAMAEISTAIRTLVARIREPRLVGPIILRPYNAGIGGPNALPIAFTPR
jgi:cytochrome P450